MKISSFRLPPVFDTAVSLAKAEAIDTFRQVGASVGSAKRRAVRALEVATFTPLIQSRITGLYAQQSGFSQRELRQASEHLGRLLDPSGWCFFTADLESLARDRRVSPYLHALKQALDAGPVDLWAFTSKHTDNEAETTRWLALLFQDMCSEHPRFFKDIGDSSFREDLQATVSSLRAAIERNHVRPFPDAEMNKRFDTEGLYHYYVPAYLAQKMVRSGVTPELAFVTAATLNLEYELYSAHIGGDRKAATATEIAGLLPDPLALADKVQRMRTAGLVTSAFRVEDLDWNADLHLDDALLPVIAERYHVALERLASVSPRTAETLACAIAVEAQKRLTPARQFSESLDFLINGAKPGTDVDPTGQDEALFGFAGAARVLPSFDTRDVRRALRENPTRFMQQLFARASEGSTPVRDAAPIAVIDQSFDAVGIAHGTAVSSIASAGGIPTLAIEGNISSIVEALDRAAAAGARVVNISQEMYGDSAADVELFRQALARHPDVLVVMAAGNNATRVGNQAFNFAAVTAPNFAKVAAATRVGELSPVSSYDPTLVQFAAFGDTDRASLWRGSLLSSIEHSMHHVLRPQDEMTSFAAPQIANLAARLRTCAPHLTAAQTIALLAASCPGPLGGVSAGIPNAARAFALLATPAFRPVAVIP